MSWFPVDDDFFMHPKAVQAGNAALGLWVRAGSWSMKHTTEGHVPEYVVSVLGGRKRDVEKLLAAGLWQRTDDGYTFHDWEAWGDKKTREQVLTRRQAEAERKRRQRERERAALQEDPQVNDQSHGVTPPGQEAESQRDLVSNTNTNTNTTTTTPSKPKSKSLRDPDGFDEFWKAYPRREAKQGAKAKYARLLRDGMEPETLIEGARRYAAYCARVGREREKIKIPTTWLNQGCWEDDLDSTPGAPPAASPASDPTAWLQEQWRQGVVSEIEQRTGLRYPDPQPPADVDSPGKWVMLQRRDWITDQRHEILARLEARQTCLTN